MTASATALLLVVAMIGLYAEGKVLSQCQLAKDLVKKHGIPRNQVADWVCLAKHESSYNTRAINKNRNGSRDHGIFQINDKYWCSAKGRGKDCNINCSSLRDDNIGDDVRCAKVIYKRHGFSAWVAWKNKCRGKNLSAYIKGCGI